MATRASLISLISLAAATTACFSDQPPGDLTATSAATSTSTGATTTTATTTGGGPGSSGGETTGAPTTTHATGTTGTTAPGEPSTGSTGVGPGTSTTGPDGTTTADTTTADGPGSTTTGPPDFDLCGDKPNRYECYICCASLVPASAKYFDDVEVCACDDDDACVDQCELNLCFNMPIGSGCFACLAPNFKDPCMDSARAHCEADTQCAQFLACVGGLGCDAKPG